MTPATSVEGEIQQYDADCTLIDRVLDEEKLLSAHHALSAPADGSPPDLRANATEELVAKTRERLLERRKALKEAIGGAARLLDKDAATFPAANGGSSSNGQSVSALSRALATTVGAEGEPSWVDTDGVSAPVLEAFLDAGLIERHPVNPKQVRRHPEISLGAGAGRWDAA